MDKNGKPIDPTFSPGAGKGIFFCQPHKMKILHIMRSFNAPGFLAAKPGFFNGVTDEDVNSIVLKYLRYRYIRENQQERIKNPQIPKGAGNQVWNDSLNISETFDDFKALIEHDIETWFEKHPGAGGGGVGGASGGARSANGEFPRAPFSDDFIEAKFNQLKRRFSGNTDEEIHAVILNLLDHLRRSNQTLFPEFAWNKYIMKTEKLEDFESFLKGGLGNGGKGKGLMWAQWKALHLPRPESPAESSGDEEEEEEEMDEGYFAGPHSPPHYPPQSPSSSFQHVGAPAEAFASLRL